MNGEVYKQQKKKEIIRLNRHMYDNVLRPSQCILHFLHFHLCTSDVIAVGTISTSLVEK